MRVITPRRRSQTSESAGKPATGEVVPGLADQMAARLIGQGEAIRAIVPYVQLFHSALSPRGRPVGVIMLLGPSGTGKTLTVETLASLLHGSARNVLKVDCGEFQMDHEVAKLIGAPPGYLGHRETRPMLSQEKLNAVTSAQSGLSLVLLDEVEKAAPSMARLLLGVFDKATLRLGDNNTVNFENSLIFLTSNLGSTEMSRAADDMAIGFGGVPKRLTSNNAKRLATRALRRKFPVEFINRIDEIVTYRPLTSESIGAILLLELDTLRQHLKERLFSKAPDLEVRPGARAWLIEHGVSADYGARPLRRLIQTQLLHPIAALVDDQDLESKVVRVDVAGEALSLRVEKKK